ncbi:MAG: LysR family transcriptional regulator [Caulobacteraceae bacterium]
MKIQHLQYVLEIADSGSINKAADKLLLSQPNVSSALKTLEGELGFPIFSRTNKGITLTSEGRQFLSCARRMVAEYEQITTIKTGEKVHRFHLSAGYHSAIEEAFAILCSEYQDSAKLNFIITNADADSIIENVYLNKSDLGILLLPQNMPSTLLSLCDKKDLTVSAIRELCFNVNLSRNHPLLKDKDFDIKKLRNYPFVDYEMKILSSSSDLVRMGIIDPDKRILVDERDTRCHIVATTNAFSIGCGLHPRIRERYNWVCIPLPGIVFQMVSIHRRDSSLSAEARRYLQILKREIAEV